MVDPNRKINRLTDKDIEFLDVCEEEFAYRYTEEDEEFMLHFSKPLADPPIVDNWGFIGNNHNQSNNRVGGQRNNFYSSDGDRGGRGGMRNNRGWQNRRGSERGTRNYGRNRHDHAPYSREQHSNERRYNDDRGSESGDHNRPPMNVRRDYGNFVAASKD